MHEIIDKIIKLFPELKENRDYILNEIVTPIKPLDSDYVLEKITIQGEVYYKDRYKCILNSNIELVGIWSENEGKHIYHIFKNDIYNCDDLHKKFSIEDNNNFNNYL